MELEHSRKYTFRLEEFCKALHIEGDINTVNMVKNNQDENSPDYNKMTAIEITTGYDVDEDTEEDSDSSD